MRARSPSNWFARCGCVVVCGLLLGTPSLAAPLVRSANTSLRLPTEAPLSGFAVSNALEGLRFEAPVAIASPPGETNRLFVVERTGRIMVVTNLARPDKTLFLDLTSSLSSFYLESGLLGMAFHPGYATNRQVFVFRTMYTSTAGSEDIFHDVVSRFEADPLDPHRADPESETRILAQVDDRNTHNGGDLQFGPDGYLYIAVGDEGPSPARRSPLTHQPIDRDLFGGILRIDVDRRPGSLPPNPHPAVTDHYAIPPDNPFLGVTNYQGVPVRPWEVRTEFYAVGFRNPWRMAFDPVTGELYVGEVGNSAFEEINRVEPGGNYGWPYLEAQRPSPYYPQRPTGFESQPPLVSYTHGNDLLEGNCVIGGLVYRGERLPGLREHYLFADLIRGHVWAASIHDTNRPTAFHRLTADPGIVAFGRDPRDQEVLLVNYREGMVRHLVHVPPEEGELLPPTLAETGAFADLALLTPQPGIVPYEINLPFWSDHAIKTRWFSLPDPERKITYHPTGNWQFPTGTVWIKHFELELTNGIASSRRRLETRFLVQGTNGIHGLTYRWAEDQSNAHLVPEQGLDETFLIHGPEGVRTQVWHYPGRVECRSCHTRAAGWALGFNTVQLNRSSERLEENGNQLVALADAGYVDGPIDDAASLRRLAALEDESVPVQDRVRGYLQANCTPCHQPGGLPETTAYWDARIATPMAATRILDNMIVRPHVLRGSALYERVSTPGAIHMPPLATSVLDTNAIGLLEEWITTLPTAPWTAEDIGGPAREGSSALHTNRIEVAGPGRDIGPDSDQFHFLHQPMSGNGQVVVRLASQQTTGPEARAGVMFRSGPGTNAAFGMVSLLAGGGSRLEWRSGSGRTVERAESLSGQSGDWLRLVNENGALAAHVSPDGMSDWTWLGTRLVALGSTPRFGLAATAHHDNEVNLARFEDLSALFVRLTVEPLFENTTAPAMVPMGVELRTIGSPVERVRYFRNSELLGEALAPPYSFTWSNAPAGTYTLTAQAFDHRGLSVRSQGIPITVAMPPAFAQLRPDPAPAGGDWTSRFGREGYLIVNDHTNLPPQVQWHAATPGSVTWELPSEDPRALERALEPGRIASAWTSIGELTLDLVFSDGHLHRLTAYFLDWESGNTHAQRIELLDGVTGQPLGVTKVSGYGEGTYLSWSVRGHVRMRLRPLDSDRVQVSGIFVDADPNLPPEVILVSPSPGTTFEASTEVVLMADSTDPEGRLDRVEFLANETLLGADAAAPFEWRWNEVLAGQHQLRARAVDQLGESRLSQPVLVEVEQAPVQARFIRTDRGVAGDWLGAYGAAGWSIPGLGTNLPAFAQLRITGQPHTWAATTPDPRGLQRPPGTNRIASCWTHDPGAYQFFLHLDLLDGHPHQVALYFLDWDHGAREQTVSVWNQDITTRFIQSSVSDFSGGLYALWQVRGSITFQIKRSEGTAVVGGLFIDPPMPEFLAWSLDHFTEEQRGLPWISGLESDPDLDRLPNLLEYALGLDPWHFNAGSGFASRIEHDALTGQARFVVDYARRREPTQVRYLIESSGDFTTWQPAGDRFVPAGAPTQLGGGDMEQVHLRLEPTMEEMPRSFFRLRVEYGGEEE